MTSRMQKIAEHQEKMRKQTDQFETEYALKESPETKKCEFLDGWKLLINKIPPYPDFEGVFHQQLDYELAELILNSDDPKYTPQMKTSFRNSIFKTLPKTGVNLVVHNQRKGLGRFYPDADKSIIVHPRIIKHTIFSYLQYKDIDQSKGHPTIMYLIGKMNNHIFENIKYYIDNFDEIVKIFIEFYSAEETPLDKDDIKYLFNLTIYGGGFSTWKTAIEAGDLDKGFSPKKLKTYKIHEIYKKFKDDCVIFKEKVFENNPDLKAKFNEPELYKLKSSMISYFLQTFENDNVYHAKDYLTSIGVIKPKHESPEYDGLCLPPFNVEMTDDEIINGVNQWVLEKTGFAVIYKFKEYGESVDYGLIQRRRLIEEEKNKIANVYKEIDTIKSSEIEDLKKDTVTRKEQLHKLLEDNETETDERLKTKRLTLIKKEKETIDKNGRKIERLNKAINKGKVEAEKKTKKLKALPENAEFFAETDNEAGEYLFKKLKDRLICCNGQMFLKRENVWYCDNDYIKKYLLAYIMNANIYTNDFKPYSQNVVDAHHIREVLLTKVETDVDAVDLYEKFHSTTKGRICFKDGVLDFNKKKFYKWKDVDFEYYTCIMINRDFGKYFNNPNLEVMKTVKENIFDNIFGNKMETALHFLSRALAGYCEDKNWATYLGNRDCGKGVLYDALKFAFGEYVGTFELANIMYNRQSMTEETSRMLYWLIDLQFMRLAISQETPAPSSGKKASGKMIKKMAGGGDTHVARRNYDRKDTHFKIDTTFFIMGNNALEVDLADTMEHCIEFNSVNQFKTQEDIDRMKADGQNELLWSSYKIKDDNIKQKCQSNEWCDAVVYLLYKAYQKTAVPILRDVTDDNEAPVRNKILTNFTITRDIADEILVSVVNELLQDDKKKINNELESMGVKKVKSKSGDNRDKMIFQGIKVIPL